jgi:hypothetical protein
MGILNNSNKQKNFSVISMVKIEKTQKNKLIEKADTALLLGLFNSFQFVFPEFFQRIL